MKLLLTLLALTTTAQAAPMKDFEVKLCLIDLSEKYGMPNYQMRHLEQALLDRSVSQDTDFLTLTLAVIAAESAFNYKAVSSAGAKGLMQLMDVAVEEVQSRFKKYPKWEPFDIRTNIWYGTRYLSLLIESYGVVGGLAFYNGGWKQHNNLTKGKKLVNETAQYISKVLYTQELCK